MHMHSLGFLVVVKFTLKLEGFAEYSGAQGQDRAHQTPGASGTAASCSSAPLLLLAL
jgi:hypothetical protein